MNNPLGNTNEVNVIAYKDKEKCNFKCLSWSAVIAGALVGIGISFIFNLFAMATGLAAFAATTAGPKALAIGGIIGLVIIAIFSMGTAGWVAGYLGRPKSMHRDMGVLYGFTAWCVALILTILLSGHIGKFVAYNASALQNPSYTITNVARDHVTSPAVTTEVTDTNSQVAQTDTVVVNAQDAAKVLAMSTFVSFVLFFIGALASCLGGHLGFRSCEKDLLRYRNRDDRI